MLQLMQFLNQPVHVKEEPLEKIQQCIFKRGKTSNENNIEFREYKTLVLDRNLNILLIKLNCMPISTLLFLLAFYVQIINQVMPGASGKRHKQIVQTHIRHHKTQRLINVYTICVTQIDISP